jgi:hypothetical protein
VFKSGLAAQAGRESRIRFREWHEMSAHRPFQPSAV